MARLVYYAAMTLDGFIAEADDTIGWLTSYDGTYAAEDAEPMEGNYARFYDGIGALVMGSATYEFVLEAVEGGGSSPYRGKPSWILTSGSLPIPPGDGVDIRFHSGAVAEIRDELIAAAGNRDVWIVGGGNVASQFADESLLDELRVHVVPVVLGTGKPLFDRRLPANPVQLTRAVPQDNGMVELTYELRASG